MLFHCSSPNKRIPYGGTVTTSPNGVPIRTGSRFIQFRNGVYKTKSRKEAEVLKKLVGSKFGIYSDELAQIQAEEPSHYAKCTHCGDKFKPQGVKSHERVCKSNPANKEPEQAGDMTQEPKGE